MEADGTCFSTGFSLNFVAKLILQLPRSARSVGSRSSGKRLEGGRMKLQGEARSPLGFKNRLKLRQDVARIKRSASRMRAARNREDRPLSPPLWREGDRHHGGEAIATTTTTTRRTRGREACHLRIIREEVVPLHGGVGIYTRRVRVYTTWPLLAAETRRSLPRTDRLGRMERGISHGNVKEDGGKKALVKQRRGPSFSLLSRLLNSLFPPAPRATD